ncbi:MAG TPA: ATP-binding cassette domain-containing protein [Candidatus Acidoferrales bacterium]|nr:ATP-binding cassette domain-containing protein [Candidatus Acidoferrales bacterium]
MSASPPLLNLTRVTVFRRTADDPGAQNAPTSEVAPEVVRPALDDISLRIEAGEHVCILGPNGCGKSTLIKTITRECYPAAREGSSISILGRKRWNIFELRSLMGIVSPDLLGACTTDATGRDVVLSGFFSSTRIFPHHHPDPAQLALADRALQRMGVAHLGGRAVARMSSGEAKRTLIARALVHDPRALLFDEPSNALDIAAQLQLRAAMRELAQSGIAILLVTHHVSEIIPEIERVILLRDGRIVADGGKAEVLTSEGMSALFGIPLRLSQQDGYFHIRE